MTPADQIAQTILSFEGGVADIGDGAGETSFGQTQVWLDQWSLTRPTTPAQAAQNITAWLVLSGLIQVVNVSLPLGTAIADFGFNSGLAPAIRALQAALGVTVDGLLGSQTLAALAKVDPATLVRPIAKARLHFLGQALAHGQISTQFAPGLIDRVLTYL